MTLTLASLEKNSTHFDRALDSLERKEYNQFDI